MGLLADVEAVCRRLAPAGWAELLAAHGLDLTADDLAAELARELGGVDRSLPGFEDFSADGRRGVEPGRPAESLLLHALASPNVKTRPDGRALSEYPTLAELEAVENYVFALAQLSLDELRSRFPGAPMAIVVLAYEYRPAVDTVHRDCADLCFSRTGVARVGTLAARYGGAERGFLAASEAGARGMCVLPARYAPWIAVELTGDETLFGPMNFDLRHRSRKGFAPIDRDDAGDAGLSFWVPLHKLFGGPECLRGLDLTVELETGHVNEKLRRIHLELGVDVTGQGTRDLSREPFVFRTGIAELSAVPDHGTGVLSPVAHKRLVEPAEYEGAPLDFVVPPGQVSPALGPSLAVSADPDGFRHSPEYVHARHRIEPDGQIVSLNDDPDVLEQVIAGGYKALHYVDFTGDGWVQAFCPQLEDELLRSIPAYSLVTAPDFYPDIDQREISEWWLEPPEPPFDAWRAPPFTLSDVRLLPNLEHPDSRLLAADGVASAIVSMPTRRAARENASPAPLKRSALGRHPHLPDAAASVFAPGWDVSVDGTPDEPHMAAYGLGSPFPEDAKLCAALSSFWPAVAPDAARTFSFHRPTVAPLSDMEIGITGTQPWDGISGPNPVDGTTVEYASWNHADYVEEALEGRFTLAHTSRVSTAEYAARILAMALAYAALAEEGQPDPRSWRVLGFRPVADGDAALCEAQADTGEVLEGDRFAITLVLPLGDPAPKPGDHRTMLVRVQKSVEVLAGALPVALVRRDGAWRARALAA